MVGSDVASGIGGSQAVTDNERELMLERKRANYRRRLQALRDAKGLEPLTNRQRHTLLDLCMRVEGDAITDPDLLVLLRLAGRGLCGVRED